MKVCISEARLEDVGIKTFHCSINGNTKVNNVGVKVRKQKGQDTTGTKTVGGDT